MGHLLTFTIRTAVVLIATFCPIFYSPRINCSDAAQTSAVPLIESSCALSPPTLADSAASRRPAAGEKVGQISVIVPAQSRKARIIDVRVAGGKPCDDSQTARGPWNARGAAAQDVSTSNGARLRQPNSSGCGIYWLSPAKGESRGQEAEPDFPPAVGFSSVSPATVGGSLFGHRVGQRQRK